MLYEDRKLFCSLIICHYLKQCLPFGKHFKKNLQTLPSIAFDWVAREVRKKQKHANTVPQNSSEKAGFSWRGISSCGAPCGGILVSACCAASQGSTAVCAGLGRQVGDHSLSTAWRANCLYNMNSGPCSWVGLLLCTIYTCFWSLICSWAKSSLPAWTSIPAWRVAHIYARG